MCGCVCTGSWEAECIRWGQTNMRVHCVQELDVFYVREAHFWAAYKVRRESAGPLWMAEFVMHVIAANGARWWSVSQHLKVCLLHVCVPAYCLCSLSKANICINQQVSSQVAQVGYTWTAPFLLRSVHAHTAFNHKNSFIHS